MRRKILGSAAAIAIALTFIPPHEGRNLVAYLDPIGIPTICEGYTRGVRLGDVATDAECDQKTLEGIIEADEVFQAHVPLEIMKKISPPTHAAFLSFIYNVGPGRKGVKDGFVTLKSGRQSTMLTKLKAGDVRGACDQLPYWVSAGGKKLKGLVKRRAEERKLCLSGLR